jgi:hypothetical protein
MFTEKDGDSCGTGKNIPALSLSQNVTSGVTTMARGQVHRSKPAQDFVPAAAHTRYIVVRQGGLWFIKFDGEEYGPYNTEREAMLFAIEAAHTLGRQGEPTQVLLLDENGGAHPHWTSGLDPYPPPL